MSEGGELDKMSLAQLLDMVPIFEQMHIEGYSEFTKQKMVYDDFNNKTGNKHLSFEEKSFYDEISKRKLRALLKYKENIIEWIKRHKKAGKMSEGGGLENISFSSVAVEKANLEQLFDMAKELNLTNYQNINKEMLRKKILEHFKLNRFKVQMAKGGKINIGDTWEWHGIEYDQKKGDNYKVVKQILITNVDSKGQVKGRFVGTANDFIVREPGKYLKKKVSSSSKMITGGQLNALIEDIKEFEKNIYPENKDISYKNRLILATFKRKGYSTKEIVEALKKIRKA